MKKLIVFLLALTVLVLVSCSIKTPDATTTTATTTTTTTTTEPPCAHDYVGEYAPAARCGEYGSTLYTCSLCGDRYSQMDTEPTDHRYHTEDLPGNCETASAVIYTCTVPGCGYTYREYDPDFVFKSHEYEIISHTERDCVNYETTVYRCSGCGKERTDRGDALDEHSWSETEHVLPDCCHYETVSYECDVCHGTRTEQLTDEYMPHSWDTKYTTDLPATTESSGIKSIHCLTEGCTARKNETVIPVIDPDLPFIPVS